MSDIVEKIQKTSVRSLNTMVQQTLEEVERQIVDQIGGFLALSEKRDEILGSFISNMNEHFDKLLDKPITKEEAIFDYENLSLIMEEDLEVLVTLEGMINASRNEHLPNFISFNTRLNSVFPRKRIDETINPLDPAQISSAFQDSLRSIGMDAQNMLTVYRAFNNLVLKNLEEILHEANKILIDNGVIPDLGMESPRQKEKSNVRSSRRREQISAFGTVEEEEYEEPDDRPELFSMMQNLLHGDAAPSVANPDQSLIPPGGGTILPSTEQAGALKFQRDMWLLPSNRSSNIYGSCRNDSPWRERPEFANRCYAALPAW